MKEKKYFSNNSYQVYRFLRDSSVGRTFYRLSKNKYLRHPEEEPEYIVPANTLKKVKNL